MASTINSATSGVVITSDATGALDIQVGGTNAIQISSAANVSVANLSATSANITTLTGTNFSATSLTLTNALAVASGGSGRASTTAYAVICGGTTSTGPEQSIASVGTSGQVLTSNGAGALPTFQTLVVAGLPTVIVTASTAISATANNHYVLTATSTATLTLPASPTISDTIYVTNAGSLTTNVIARNGKPIQGIAEDMTLNSLYASAQLRFTDNTRGWVLA